MIVGIGQSITNADVAKYDRLIWKVAHRLRGAGEMNIGSDWRDELHAAGLEGLVEAFATFDPERGVAFASYVYKLARVRMLKCIAGYHGGGQQGMSHAIMVRASRRKLRERLGRDPTHDDVLAEAATHMRGEAGSRYPSKTSTIQAWADSGKPQDSVEHMLSERKGEVGSNGSNHGVFRAVPSQLTFGADQADRAQAVHDAGVAVDLAFEFCSGKANRRRWFDTWLMVRAGGKTLEVAGQEVGYTRERVRQVVDMIDKGIRKRLEG